MQRGWLGLLGYVYIAIKNLQLASASCRARGARAVRLFTCGVHWGCSPSPATLPARRVQPEPERLPCNSTAPSPEPHPRA